MTKVNKEFENKMSKFLSFILRHQPYSLGIELDEFGYALVDDLLEKMNKKNNTSLTVEDLIYIVGNDSKLRYDLKENNTKIRCNQGHSFPVNLELKNVQPPSVLYHGTATKFKKAIEEQGLKSMGRHHVHLSETKETALSVGTRHGDPIIYVVDTLEMVRDGKEFYVSANNVWLTDSVEFKYLKQIEI